MYSDKLKEIINKTEIEAGNKNMIFYPFDLLIKNIVSDKEISEKLKDKKVDVENIEIQLLKEIEKYCLENNKYDELDEELGAQESPEPDLFTIAAMARASLDVKSPGVEYNFIISEYNFLRFAIEEVENISKILLKHGMKLEYVLEELEKIKREKSEEGFGLPMDDNFEDSSGFMDDKGNLEDNLVRSPVNVKKYLINLNEKAEEGKIDLVIGRDEEILNISTILSRKTKNNPIIIGESGVGKTAVVEGLAKLIQSGECIEELRKKTIYSLDLGALIAGTKYRGELEERVDKTISFIRNSGDILFIDEIHSILSSAKEDSVNISNQLLPHLSSGDVTVIGVTTSADYSSTIEKSPALCRRFNKVYLKEMNAGSTIELLKMVKLSYEKYHNVSISDEVIEELVKLTDRYIKTNSFPDKALDLMDELSSKIKINKLKVEKEITKEDLYKLVSKKINIPLEALKNTATSKSILELEQEINSNVFGQEKAASLFADAMVMSYAGLKRKNKPIGSFLCVGPTGVGKTEVAKTIADKLTMNLVRVDMSEYSEKTSVNKLLGSDPGYVGYEEGGFLYKELKENPFSVVLFDEFEKAHPSLNNLFLQILDEGVIKDSQGRIIDFKNTIIIFTSNAGVKKGNGSEISMGFASMNEKPQLINMDKIKERFSPEFRNRLTEIVEFSALGKDSMEKVAKKGLKHIADLIKEGRNINLLFTPKVAELVAKEGFDPKMGARPIERKIEELISKPLSKKILIDGIGEGETIKTRILDGSVVFEVEK